MWRGKSDISVITPQIPAIVKPHLSQGLGQKSPSPGRPSIPLSICLPGGTE